MIAYDAVEIVSDMPAGCWIDGALEQALGESVIDLTDPACGRIFGCYRTASNGQVDDAVTAAALALRGDWRAFAPRRRAEILAKAADLLVMRSESLAKVDSLCVGKPLREARADVAVAVRFLQYYAGAADKLEGETIPLGPDYWASTELEPVGVVALIVPWNSPLPMLLRGLAPALAAGCTVIAKPAEQTPYSALVMAQIFAQAGLPAGVFNVVPGIGAQVGAQLAQHPAVAHISFTGSVATGQSVMRAAAGHVASVTLELGGKSPLVVMDDADIDMAVQGAMAGIFTNAGQVCAAASRLIVLPAIADRLIEKIIAKADALLLGPGLNDPDMGPVVSSLQLGKIEATVHEAVSKQGTQLFVGGSRALVPFCEGGYFFRPTLLEVNRADARIANEEVFGPVMVVQRAADFEHAIALANHTPFGLVAGIYTSDINKAMRFARAVDCGQVYVNRYFAGGVETPVGGTKQSGFGREKGLRGLYAYLRSKCTTVYLG